MSNAHPCRPDVLCVCNADVSDFPDEPKSDRWGYSPCPEVVSLARRHGLEVPS